MYHMVTMVMNVGSIVICIVLTNASILVLTLHSTPAHSSMAGGLKLFPHHIDV